MWDPRSSTLESSTFNTLSSLTNFKNRMRVGFPPIHVELLRVFPEMPLNLCPKEFYNSVITKNTIFSKNSSYLIWWLTEKEGDTISPFLKLQALYSLCLLSVICLTVFVSLCVCVCHLSVSVCFSLSFCVCMHVCVCLGVRLSLCHLSVCLHPFFPLLDRVDKKPSCAMTLPLFPLTASGWSYRMSAPWHVCWSD